jgi:hypothetical protein
MSQVDMQKTFHKILKENVLSGDFKLANFKANLKVFLKFVANTFLLFNTELPERVDTVITDASSKLVAGQFVQLKSPKSSRAYVSAVYASLVLGCSFNNKEEVRDHLKSRYGSQLVLAADSLDIGKLFLMQSISVTNFHAAMKHINGVKKRKASTDEEPARSTKRQKVRGIFG